jgi:hypothetical protein
LPEQNAELFVKISNFGTETVTDLPVQLAKKGTIRGVVNVTVEAGKSSIVSISFNRGQQGWKEFEVRISGDAFNFDDVLYLSFMPRNYP